MSINISFPNCKFTNVLNTFISLNNFVRNTIRKGCVPSKRIISRSLLIG